MKTQPLKVKYVKKALLTTNKPGYATEVVIVNVIAGELCNIVVELVKI